MFSSLSVFLIFSHVAKLFESGFVTKQPGRDDGVRGTGRDRGFEYVAKVIISVMLHPDFDFVESEIDEFLLDE